MGTLHFGKKTSNSKEQYVDITDPTELIKPGKGRVTYRHTIEREFVQPGIYRLNGVVARVCFNIECNPGTVFTFRHIQRVGISGTSLTRVRLLLNSILSGAVEPDEIWGKSSQHIREEFGAVDPDPNELPDIEHL